MKKLTSQRERFCKEYMGCMNAARAATAAGFAPKGAKVAGQRLLRNEVVKRRLDELRNDVAQACDLSAAMLVTELKKIAFANTADAYYPWGNLKSLDDLPEDVRTSIQSVKCNSKMVGNERIDIVTVKFHDKMKALNKLIELLGYDVSIPKMQIPAPQSQMPKVVIIQNPHLRDQDDNSFKF
jgi:phage terminase small subunit